MNINDFMLFSTFMELKLKIIKSRYQIGPKVLFFCGMESLMMGFRRAYSGYPLIFQKTYLKREERIKKLLIYYRFLGI